jgi:DNA-directed RNA polymerase subunit RPC12/RpoP
MGENPNKYKMTNLNSKKCSICGKPFNSNDFGHNPFPLMKNKRDRCCDECNHTFVIPSRILTMGLSNKELKKCTNKYGWLNNVDGTINLITSRF